MPWKSLLSSQANACFLLRLQSDRKGKRPAVSSIRKLPEIFVYLPVNQVPELIGSDILPP